MGTILERTSRKTGGNVIMAKKSVRKYKNLEHIAKIGALTPEIKNVLTQKREKVMKDLKFIDKLLKK